MPLGYPTTQIFNPNGSTNEFTLSDLPAPGSLLIFWNGVAQTLGKDYSLAGSTFTMVLTPGRDDSLLAYYMSASSAPVPTSSGCQLSTTQFRADFPEFGNIGVFPDSMVQYWIRVANLLLNPKVWCSALCLATELFTAHQLTIEAETMQTANIGGFPGKSKGPINNSGVGGVSVGYDSVQSSEAEGGHWNLTVYGTRVYRLIRMFGARVTLLNPRGGPGTPFAGGAYSGPLMLPGMQNFGN